MSTKSSSFNSSIIRLGKAFASKRAMFMVDWLLVIFSYTMVILILRSLSRFYAYFKLGLPFMALCSTVFVALLFASGNYKVMWKHGSLYDYAKLIGVCIATTIITVVASDIMPQFNIYVKHTMLADFIATVLICIYRIIIKTASIYVTAYFKARNSAQKTNVLIVGAGSAAALFINELNSRIEKNYNIVGLVDDDKKKKGAVINGIRVMGTRDDINDICRNEFVDEIVFAIPTATTEARREIISICHETGCKVMVMPLFDEIAGDEKKLTKLRKVKIEDLLVRDPIVLDDNGINEKIKDKTVMVTGGGGSIGSELCRQIIKYNPKHLIILDIYENNAYDLQNELLSKYSNLNLTVLIASVRDDDRLDIIFDTYKPDIVFHAAAHKHVPLMEDSPSEAVKNNVFGTYNVAKCADRHGVEKFVMISTDKAVNPTNVMGATKRMCEMIIQAMSKVSKTQFVAVRFGNVLGSNGSVIPLFKRQIENGGPLTVTHKEITRFFMTIPEAAQLVIQAACFAGGGEIFVLDMGQPVRIYDLAVNMIRLSGLVPDKDIKIEISGLRPGEKLYEELLMSEEGLKKTSHSKIFIGHPLDIDMSIVDYKLKTLEAALNTGNNEKIKNAVKEVVPTYSPATVTK